MTKEDAKKFLPIIKAYSEGKNILYKGMNIHNFAFNGNVEDYTVQSYRPFKNANEAFIEAKKHNFLIKSITNEFYYQILSFKNSGCALYGGEISYKTLCNFYIWTDDYSSCGLIN